MYCYYILKSVNPVSTSDPRGRDFQIPLKSKVFDLMLYVVVVVVVNLLVCSQLN